MAALKAVVAQLLAWGLSIAIAPVLAPSSDALVLAIVQAPIAALAGWAMGSERWWIGIHLVFSPALVLALRLDIEPWWALGAFVALALTFWSAARGRVPLFLTNAATAAAICDLARQERCARMVDLGSGTGSMLARVARACPELRCDGVESAPLPYLVSKLGTRRIPNAHVVRGDLWQARLGGYDLAYAFLSPVPMPRLWDRLRVEMRPGSLLVSNSFPVPAVEPDRVIEVSDRRRTRLYVYRIPP